MKSIITRKLLRLAASQRLARRVASRLGACFVLLCLTACTVTPQLHDDTPAPQADPAELIARYNTNAAKLDKVAANTSVFLNFRDPETGKMRREVGDGLFRYRGPRDMVLTAGKLGNNIIWTGGNTDQFWLFDLDQDLVYVGSYAAIGSPDSEPLPMPARPDQVVVLFGLVPIDPTDAETEWVKGNLLVEPSGSAVRLLLDGHSGLAKRIDLLDANGYSVILCEFTGQKAVKQPDTEEATWPIMPAEAHLQVVGEEGDMTLKLYNYSADPDKFKDKAFNFEKLVVVNKPKVVIRLDE